MSVTVPRPLVGRFRTDLVLLTVQAVTQRLTGHPIFLVKTEPMTGRQP
jgi:hypothetical protein